MIIYSPSGHTLAHARAPRASGRAHSRRSCRIWWKCTRASLRCRFGSNHVNRIETVSFTGWGHCVPRYWHQPSWRRWLGDDAVMLRQSLHARAWEAREARGTKYVLRGRAANWLQKAGWELYVQVRFQRWSGNMRSLTVTRLLQCSNYNNISSDSSCQLIDVVCAGRRHHAPYTRAYRTPYSNPIASPSTQTMRNCSPRTAISALTSPLQWSDSESMYKQRVFHQRWMQHKVHCKAVSPLYAQIGWQCENAFVCRAHAATRIRSFMTFLGDDGC